VVENCWSTAWTDLRLSRRERSLLTLGITAAMGRFDEFELHVRGAYNNGVTREELEALAIHIGVYAGIPTALGARRALKRATGSGEEPDTEASASGLPS
jgi:4-carboxymuconolactone decarboxylase